MSLSIEEIKKNYSQFPDYKIEQIAERDSQSLSPEVVAVLLDEIEKRGLHKNLLESVNIQRIPLSEEKLKKLKQAVLNTSCPSCASKGSPLTTLKIVETLSAVFFVQNTIRVFIACPTCCKKEFKRAMLKTAVLGWWSPHGFLYYTPKSLIQSYANFQHAAEHSSELIDLFVIENLGSIQTVIDNPIQLSKLLQRYNKQ